MPTTRQELELERAHHDKESKNYTERRKFDYIWEVPEELFLLRKNYFKKGMTVVDMGCGPAVSVSRILGRATLAKIHYVGVDISEKMLREARLFIPTGTFIRADIETVKLPPLSADTIISLGALHHALNHEKTLAHWLTILKPGGILLMREPLLGALRRGSGESPMEEGIDVGHIKKFFRKNHCVIHSTVFFSSNAFHFANRVMIKLKLGRWQRIKFLWYPAVLLDALCANTLGRIFPFFQGLAAILVVRKNT